MVLAQLLLSPIGSVRIVGTKNNLLSLVLIGFVEFITFGVRINLPLQGYSSHPALYINCILCGMAVAFMVYNSIFYRLESNLEAWPWASAGDENGEKSSTTDTHRNSTGGTESDGKNDNEQTNKEHVCPFSGHKATMTCPICQTKVHRSVWHERDPWLTLRIGIGLIILDVDRHGRVSNVMLAREHAMKARKVAKKNRLVPTRGVPFYALAPPPGYRHSRNWLLWWQKAPFKGHVPFSNGMVPEYALPCQYDGPPLTDDEKRALAEEEQEARHAVANFLTAAISEMCVGCYAHNLYWNVGPRLFYTQVILSLTLTLLLHALDRSYATLGARVFLDGISAYYAFSSMVLAFNFVASTRMFQLYYNKLPYKWPLKPWEGRMQWLANFSSSHPEAPPGIPEFLIPEALLDVTFSEPQRRLRMVQNFLFSIIATYRLPPDYEPPPKPTPPPPPPPPPPAPPSSSLALPASLAGFLNAFGLGAGEASSESRPSIQWINPAVISSSRRSSMASVVGMPLQAPVRTGLTPTPSRRPSLAASQASLQQRRRSSILQDVPEAAPPPARRPSASPLSSRRPSAAVEGSSRRSSSASEQAEQIQTSRFGSAFLSDTPAQRPSASSQAGPLTSRRSSAVAEGSQQRRPSVTSQQAQDIPRRSSLLREPAFRRPPQVDDDVP